MSRPPLLHPVILGASTIRSSHPRAEVDQLCCTTWLLGLSMYHDSESLPGSSSFMFGAKGQEKQLGEKIWILIRNRNNGYPISPPLAAFIGT